MVTNEKLRTLEEGIALLQKEARSSALSVGKIFRLLSGRGRPFILIVLSLPFCLPIQIPGLSTPFGLAISFVGLRIAFGIHMWLPKKLLSKKIASTALEKITKNMLIILKKMKPWIHCRLCGLCHTPVMKIMNGLIIFILGIFLALPLPIPFSNLAAAWSIFLIALGIVKDDGIFILMGYSASLLTIGFFIFMIVTAKHIFYN